MGSVLMMVSLAAKNGVVVAVEKKQKSVLYDESSINKVNWTYSAVIFRFSFSYKRRKVKLQFY